MKFLINYLGASLGGIQKKKSNPPGRSRSGNKAHLMGFKKMNVALIMVYAGAMAQSAQLPSDPIVKLEKGTLRSVFDQIQEQTPLSFAYTNGEVDEGLMAELKWGETRLKTVLNELDSQYQLRFRNIKNVIYVSNGSKDDLKTREKQQEPVTVRGKVLDEDGKPLPGVNVLEKGTSNGVVSDMDGSFRLKVSGSDAVIQVSYIGYLSKEIPVEGRSSLTIDLTEDATQLDEVIVTRERQLSEIKKPQMSVNSLSMQQIKRTPAVLGESDPLKSILQLPGVTNAGEASSGFNVRGGATDQNLILLDGSPIFSDSHLFGFFSVFNADVISNLELYKGGIPASFGGRVSSVLDVHQKTGDPEDFHMNGGIGLISSRLLAEGPFDKGRGSFVVAGRASYAHLFLKLADNENSAYFYDLNTKLNYRLNGTNSLFFSGYYGRDVFDISDSFSSSYGNTMANLRWKKNFSDLVTADLSLIYSDYLFGLNLGIQDFEWDSSIKNFGLKYDFKHHLSEDIQLNYGANALYYDFNPGTLRPDGDDSGINFQQLDKKYALEPAFYLDVEHTISEKISVRYGLRYSMFYRYGQEDITLYEDDLPVIFNPDLMVYEKAEPIGSTPYGKGENIASFDNLEPRLGISYSLNDNTSFKASYNRMAQYLHLIANTQSPTPVNVWTPSGPYIKPQLLDQWALGYFRNLKDGAYSLETEVFYKEVQNRIDYIDGADLIANNNIEQSILNGEARSYGLEVLLRKNEGKFTGWISYTLSRSEQRTPGRSPEETGINDGDWYLTPYDKMHNLTLAGAYGLNDKWSFGANFTFQTGQPVTFPTGKYEFGGIMVPNYTSRNGDRLPAYHHLDLSATYVPKPDKKNGWRSEWVFSLYNLYNRQNSASVSFRANEDTGINEAVRLSIFGIIPSVSYNFKF
ncbi:MAG: carboxypeptidase-like regulatory domain-containing protein [Sediminicola sp.]